MAFVLTVASVAGGGDLFEVLARLVLGGSVIIAYFDMKSAVETATSSLKRRLIRYASNLSRPE